MYFRHTCDCSVGCTKCLGHSLPTPAVHQPLTKHFNLWLCFRKYDRIPDQCWVWAKITCISES